MCCIVLVSLSIKAHNEASTRGLLCACAHVAPNDDAMTLGQHMCKLQASHAMQVGHAAHMGSYDVQCNTTSTPAAAAAGDSQALMHAVVRTHETA